MSSKTCVICSSLILGTDVFRDWPFLGCSSCVSLVTQVIVKKDKIDLALELFAGSNVQITLGTRVLGSVIGTQKTCDKFLDGKSAEQKKLLSKLGDIPKNESAESVCLRHQMGETK